MRFARTSSSLLVSGVFACAGVTATAAERPEPATQVKPRVGGTVLFGADQEPRHLNDFVEGGDHLWAAAAHYPTTAGAFTITPRYSYRNDLVSSVRFRRTGGTMVVRYVIAKRARWSDGVPITAEDFRFTWQTIISPRYHNPSSGASYEPIASVSG